MAITDRTRKILWGRSGNRCAYCRRELVEEGTDLSDESVVGDEVHIIGEKPTAARGQFGVGRTDLDEYDNLILLCKVHHKLVDDQPETYTVEGLHEMKDRHKRWVKETLGARKKPRHWVMPYANNPNFVGREVLLEEMRRGPQGDDNCLLAIALVQAIHGLGGVGKTQLAIHYAHAHAEEYDGVFWIHADSPARLASDFACLYEEVDLPAAVATNDINEQVQAVVSWLESPESGAWLLIFDNVEEPETLNGYLPTRHRGHILITSRRMRWDKANHSLEVREMERGDSVKLLLRRSGQSDAEAAGRLAETLGDLPLALAQAGDYLADSGLPMRQYLALFQERRADLLRRGPCPEDYRLTVFATLDLAMTRIASPEAEDLLKVLVCLASEQIPHALLNGVLGDPLRLADALAALGRHSLIRCGTGMVELHRLVQAVGWDRMLPEEQAHQAERAVTLLESRFPEEPGDMTNWGQCRAFYAHALASARLAEKIRVALPATAELLDRVGQFEAKRGRNSDAVTILRRSLFILRDLLGDDHPRIGMSALQLARLLQEQGDLGNMRAFYEHALKHLDANDPRVPGILNSLGALAQEEGKLEEAQERLTWALKLKESHEGHGDLCRANTLMNLGIVALEMGDLATARRYQEQVLQIMESGFGKEDVEVAPALANLGNVYFSEGRFDEAKGLLARALGLFEKAYGPDHPDIATVLNSLGLIAAKQRNITLAKQRFQRALKISESCDGPEHPNVATTLYQLALVYPLDQMAEAKGMILRARTIYEKRYGAEHRRTKLLDRKLRKIEELEKR